jgi:hypothetical protein
MYYFIDDSSSYVGKRIVRAFQRTVISTPVDEDDAEDVPKVASPWNLVSDEFALTYSNDTVSRDALEQAILAADVIVLDLEAHPELAQQSLHILKDLSTEELAASDEEDSEDDDAKSNTGSDNGSDGSDTEAGIEAAVATAMDAQSSNEPSM